MNLALFVSYALYSLPGAFLPLYNLDRDISSAVTGRNMHRLARAGCEVALVYLFNPANEGLVHMP